VEKDNTAGGGGWGSSGVQELKSSAVQKFKSSKVEEFKGSKVQEKKTGEFRSWIVRAHPNKSKVGHPSTLRVNLQDQLGSGVTWS
jgi:hypothetical protein